MRGVNLSLMPLKTLRRTISAVSGRRELAHMWRLETCVKWLVKNRIDEINIGNFCRLLLRVVVIEKNESGFSVGLSYEEMTKVVLAHFPHSAVNVTHFAWYATTMRSRGEMIPVYREKKIAHEYRKKS